MITIIIIIMAIMVIIIKITPIIAVIMIINSPFQPGDFSTGSTTVMCLMKKLPRSHWVLNVNNDEGIKLINPTGTHACMACKSLVCKKK